MYRLEARFENGTVTTDLSKHTRLEDAYSLMRSLKDCGVGSTLYVYVYKVFVYYPSLDIQVERSFETKLSALEFMVKQKRDGNDVIYRRDSFILDKREV